jgi:hypothetical protein
MKDRRLGSWEVWRLERQNAFELPSFQASYLPSLSVFYLIGNTAKITALQTECETITGARFPQRA